MRNFFKVGLIVFALAIFLVPVVASAALKLPYWGPLAVKCDGNICISLCQLLLLAENLINFGLTILLFAIAPILLTWGGFVILTAGGSSERLGSGRKILMGTVVGVAIALGAYLIIGTFLWGLGIVAGEGQGKINWPNVSCSAGEPPVINQPATSTTPTNPGGNNGGRTPNCPTCEEIDFPLFEIKAGSNSGAHPKMIEQLTCLSNAYMGRIRVTEAFPPTVAHNSPKHYNGCAIDITPELRYRDNCTVIQGIIDDARGCGLYVKNEYFSCGGSLSDLGTASHLHLEAANCP